MTAASGGVAPRGAARGRPAPGGRRARGPRRAGGAPQPAPGAPAGVGGAGQARPDRSAARVRVRARCSGSSCARACAVRSRPGSVHCWSTPCGAFRERRPGCATCCALHGGRWTPSSWATRRPRRPSATRSRTPSATPTTCTPRAVPSRDSPRTAGSRRSTATRRAICCCPPTPRARPRRARGAGGRRALHRPDGAEHDRGPARRPAPRATTSSRPWSTCDRRRPGPDGRSRGPAGRPHRVGGPRGRPGRAARRRPGAGQRLVSDLSAPLGPTERRPPPGRRRVGGVPVRGSTWTGRPGCPRAAGTASRPPTGRGWRRTAAGMAEPVADGLGDGAARVLVLGFEELMYAPLLTRRDARGPCRPRTSGSPPPPGRPSSPSTTPGTRSGPAWRSRPRRPRRRAGPEVRLQRRPRLGRDGFDRIVLVVGRRRRHRGARGRPAGGGSARSRPCSSPGDPPPGGGDVDHAAVRPGVRQLRRRRTSRGCSPTCRTRASKRPPSSARPRSRRRRAHYAESLPVEYQPGAEYLRLFHEALEASAERLAYAIGLVTELVLAERGPGAVLVSLARAGTPVGILMRRWARYAHGLDLPHYAVSASSGRAASTPWRCGYLAEHHDPASVMFVDGWTGKGAITPRARRRARPGARSPAELAVLADPGRCTPLFGTRDDFLIPSACLNSTVSGLVVAHRPNADLIGPGAVPRRQVLRRPRRRRRVRRLPRRRRGPLRRRSPNGSPRDRPVLARLRPHARLGGLGRAVRLRRASTASTTSTWSSPASARPPGCCCAASRGRCCRPDAGPELSHILLLAEHAACRSSRSNRTFRLRLHRA